MTQTYSFREVRKSEAGDVLMYATAQGVDLGQSKLKHHLSLIAVDEDKQVVAAALCLVDKDGRHNIAVLSNPELQDDEQVHELTHRCLRKMQSQTIGSARINSPSAQPAEGILTQSNWLDQIEETPPLDEDTEVPSDQPSQAA